MVMCLLDVASGCGHNEYVPYNMSCDRFSVHDCLRATSPASHLPIHIFSLDFLATFMRIDLRHVHNALHLPSLARFRAPPRLASTMQQSAASGSDASGQGRPTALQVFKNQRGGWYYGMPHREYTAPTWCDPTESNAGEEVASDSEIPPQCLFHFDARGRVDDNGDATEMGMDPPTEKVHPKTGNVDPKSEMVNDKKEMVDPKSEMVDPKNEMVGPSKAKGKGGKSKDTLKGDDVAKIVDMPTVKDEINTKLTPREFGRQLALRMLTPPAPIKVPAPPAGPPPAHLLVARAGPPPAHRARAPLRIVPPRFPRSVSGAPHPAHPPPQLDRRSASLGPSPTNETKRLEKSVPRGSVALHMKRESMPDEVKIENAVTWDPYLNDVRDELMVLKVEASSASSSSSPRKAVAAKSKVAPSMIGCVEFVTKDEL